MVDFHACFVVGYHADVSTFEHFTKQLLNCRICSIQKLLVQVNAKLKSSSNLLPIAFLK